MEQVVVEQMAVFDDPDWRADLHLVVQATQQAARHFAADCILLSSLAGRVPAPVGTGLGAIAWQSFVQEVGVARGLGARGATQEIAIAVLISRFLPRTLELLACGKLTSNRAQALATELLGVHTDTAWAVDREIARTLPTLAPERIRSTARRIIDRIDADAAADRAAKAAAARCIRLRADTDGQAQVFVTGPAVPLTRWHQALTEAAHAQQAAGDPRSLDALRFDLLVAGFTCDEATPSAPVPVPLPPAQLPLPATPPTRPADVDVDVDDDDDADADDDDDAAVGDADTDAAPDTAPNPTDADADADADAGTAPTGTDSASALDADAGIAAGVAAGMAAGTTPAPAGPGAADLPPLPLPRPPCALPAVPDPGPGLDPEPEVLVQAREEAARLLWQARARVDRILQAAHSAEAESLVALHQARSEADRLTAQAVRDRLARSTHSEADRRLIRPVQLLVHVPVTTLLGLDDEPGYLQGYGWISAPQCRQLLPLAELRQVCTSPDGRVLDLASRPVRPEPTPGGMREALTAMASEPFTPTTSSWTSLDSHDPNAAMAELVRLRDRACDGPLGTAVAAHRCDLDHNRPWPDGPTAAWNLTARSRRAHRLKHAGWSPLPTITGTRWTSPAGQTTSTTDHRQPHSPLHPDAQLPDPEQLHQLETELLRPPTQDDEPPF